MIAVVDYGVGNLYSLCCSLQKIGAACEVTRSEAVLARADGVILPGVGAFGDAMDKLRELGLDRTLRALAAQGKPILGICLGMQLLFGGSDEYGHHEGLGLINGWIKPMAPDIGGRKVPHMGWNSLHLVRPDDPLAQALREGDFVYYVHSYYACGCEEAWVAVSDYGVTIPGIVRLQNVWGAQFHPEKSGNVGLAMLASFVKEAGRC